jgi:hypothetical protein
MIADDLDEFSGLTLFSSSDKKSSVQNSVQNRHNQNVYLNQSSTQVQSKTNLESQKSIELKSEVQPEVQAPVQTQVQPESNLERSTWASTIDIETQMRMESMMHNHEDSNDKRMSDRLKESMAFQSSFLNEPQPLKKTATRKPKLEPTDSTPETFNNRLDPFEYCHRNTQYNFDRIATVNTRMEGKQTVTLDSNNFMKK